ncbi:MAG: alpha/beta fold hydrolase, partial [Ilumatobacteraceae bacterium]
MADPASRRPVDAPPLPQGAAMELPGRGTTFVRTVPGPPGAPTVLLLHGWTATADLNFFRCYAPLGKHFRVVALDHRGHGRGIRSRRLFRLDDCADDAAAVLDVLGIERCIPIGYSMGGPVAQLMWKRHRDRVDGLVLCSTSGYFATSREERLRFLGLSSVAAMARVTPRHAQRWLTDQLYLQRKTSMWEPWAVHEAGLHDWRTVLEAGGSLGSFSSREWLGDIDVPTSVVITMRDRVVPVRRQVRLYESIAGAEAFRIDADHAAAVSEPDVFVPTLLHATASVVSRYIAAAGEG